MSGLFRGICVCLLAAAGWTIGLKAETYPSLKAARAAGQIVIDGRLSEPDWKTAAPATDFVLLGKEDQPAPQTTQVRVLFDREALYLGAVCRITNPAKVRATGRRRDVDIGSDDVFELFLDPGQTRTSYYHIMINTLNTVYDAYCSREGGSWDQTWNGRFQSAVTVESDRWTLEMRIPFAILQLTPENSKPVWGINFGREGGSSATAYWSPAGGFHAPRGFGSLTGLDVDFRRFCWSADKLSLNKYLSADRKMAVVFAGSFANLTGRPAALHLKAELTDPQERAGELATPLDLDRDASKMIFMSSTTIPPGDYTVDVSLADRTNGALLFNRSVQLACGRAPFAARLVKPVYRQTIYDTEEKKEAVLALTFFGDSALAPDLKFEGRLLDADGTELQKKSSVITGDLSAGLGFDAQKLPVGKYRVEVSLRDTSGASLGSIVKSFQKVGPSPIEVRLDEKRRLLVAGKPFLSQQIFAISEGHKGETVWKELADGGINTGGYAGAGELDKAFAHGFMLTPHVNPASLKYKDKPGILAWYWHEEADIHTKTVPEAIVKEYRDMCEQDPYHPVEMLLYNSGMFRDVFGEMEDIYTIEPYLYPLYTDDPDELQSRMNRFVGWLDSIMEAVKMQSVRQESQKAALAVMQGWDGRAWNQRYYPDRPSPSRIPSFFEERAMSWLAFIHEFTAIGYYNYLIDYWAMDMNPLFWEGLRAVNQEIRMLSAVILEGEDITEKVAPGGAARRGAVHCQIREYQGHRYVFAANTTMGNARLELAWPDSRKLFVVSEKRSLAARKGVLTDSFAPFGVHLYTTRGPLTNPPTERMLKDGLFTSPPARVHQPGNFASQFSGAKVTSSFAHMNVRHAMFATDDDPQTCWAPSTYFKPGHFLRKPSDWLEVEFARKEKISRIVVRSYKPKYQPDPVQVLSDYTLEYWNGSAWANLASARNDLREIKQHRFPAVVTNKIRLTVTKGLYVGELEVY